MEEGDQSTHDMHLKDYDKEIYDDGDFYHQVGVVNEQNAIQNLFDGYLGICVSL